MSGECSTCHEHCTNCQCPPKMIRKSDTIRGITSRDNETTHKIRRAKIIRQQAVNLIEHCLIYDQKEAIGIKEISLKKLQEFVNDIDDVIKEYQKKIP